MTGLADIAADAELAAILREIETALEAASRPGAPFGRPVLATCGRDGEPQARTVILRHADMEKQVLRLHTDARSPKCAEIRGFPCVNLLAYDPESDVQLRIKGKARVHAADETARAAFEAATASSLRAYLAEAAPGTPRGAPGTGLPEDVEGLVPDRARLEAGWQNFAVILIEFTEIDWLKLARDGNRRARFTFGGAARAGEWLQP